MKEGDHLEDLRVDGKIILKYILREYYERVWTALLWSSIRRSGGATVNTIMNFPFHKMRKIFLTT